jgi:hypothetical protein
VTLIILFNSSDKQLQGLLVDQLPLLEALQDRVVLTEKM